MDIYLGKVTEVPDDGSDERLKFVIKFEIKDYLENQVAYPIDTFDEPNVDDPVILYRIESIFGYSFLYKKLRLDDHTRLKIEKTWIDLFTDKLEICLGDDKKVNIVLDENGASSISLGDSSEVTIEKDSGITIKGKSTITIEGDNSVEIKGKSDVKITGDYNIEANNSNLESKVKSVIKAPQVQITGGILKVNGVAAPSGSGPFCGIPVCPLTGAPHVGNQVTGT